MVYGSTIIQDHVPLAQGYGIQDQDNIFIFPRGEIPACIDGEITTVFDPVFHSLPASSSSVNALDEKPQGVRGAAYREATPDSRIAQPLFSEGGKSPNGFGADPSGQLTLPDPLVAGEAANPPAKPAVSVFVPVSPANATTEEIPVAVTRVNAYQTTPRLNAMNVSSQRLLPTAKAAPKAASNAGRPDEPDQPICKRKGCDNPTWNGKAGFYCSTACRDKDCAPKICDAPGCTRARYEGTLYCSVDCMEKTKAKKATTGAEAPVS